MMILWFFLFRPVPPCLSPFDCAFHLVILFIFLQIYFSDSYLGMYLGWSYRLVLMVGTYIHKYGWLAGWMDGWMKFYGVYERDGMDGRMNKYWIFETGL